MRIVVLGSGAMGSIFGARLKKAGHDVTLYDINAEHIAAINRAGIAVEGQEPITVKVPATTDAASLTGFELAIVYPHSGATAAVAKLAKSSLAAGAPAITLQNGIGNVEKLAAELGAERVLAGSTYISGAFLGPGRVLHSNPGHTVIGESRGGRSARAAAIARLLTEAGLPAEEDGDIMGQVWAKFCINCAINPVAAATGLRTGQVGRVQPAACLVANILDEVLMVLKAKGIKLPKPGIREYILDHLWDRYNQPSMLQHVLALRQTEIEALNGALVREAAALGLKVPYNEAIYGVVSGIDEASRLRRDKAPFDQARLEAEAAKTKRPSWP